MVLLDPVSYPGAIKAFAKEVCRNDLLNFGRLHFFFPDSRLSLDLNTDKTLKVSAVNSLFQQYAGAVLLWHFFNACCELPRSAMLSNLYYTLDFWKM